ncbi:P-loop containing nucleoside triphosphate hydrolase protein [Lentinus tigrinus ALCF2SS1-7]|uniref:P-loop containing nucleoside triphosphate hydrolase protein n=1 Tax=Lentinus tigrinus ALCF2SS1-6 TaxID=1328759 RepID=A0A5C2SDM6_9APHY|nr:P-loop containing nucleoside triphosphate hydrolase protein [Lentinus tigrinus ALCF2SS1-6]RPD74396.1 P-loop containing nucleoside triphosphate hydrolase protein [Lentinus tigrinus ALCF2SS1-7]
MGILPASPAPTNESPAIWPVHIEVRVSPNATSRFDTIRNAVHSYLTTSLSHIYLPSTIQGWEDVPLLASSIERIAASECPCPNSSLPIEQTSLQIHVYQPTDADAFEELTSGSGRGDDEQVMAASACELPSMSWEGLWESLIYSDDIKSKLLDYIYATVVFSDADVDFNVVSWNRVVLLHGPPGTGKTSLCRALAQKLSIRLSHRYSHGRLLEINSHSLFSRWFSESGKLVQKLFSSIMEMVEDEETFVIVLIDEVESLTAARAGAMAGTEPSDALRVVNALLTQLDKLKHKKNCLVMSTSNLATAIDSAFVDRADIVQYVDLPPREAIYEILRGCLVELVKRGIVAEVDVPSLAQAQIYERTADFSNLSLTTPPVAQPAAPHPQGQDTRERSRLLAIRLLSLAQKCRDQEMSGRSLRRLPVLAHARYIGTLPSTVPHATTRVNGAKMKKTNTSPQGTGAAVETWLEAMERVVQSQATERNRLQH